jgi:hypothetical protein
MRSLNGLFSVALATTMLFPGVASASYVCSVAYYNSTHSLNRGNSGSVSVQVSSTAACTSWSTFYMCSAGATSSGCHNTVRWERTELLAHTQALQNAAALDQQVDVLSGGCISGNGACLYSLTFK